jgi:hypothetical protein
VYLISDNGEIRMDYNVNTAAKEMAEGHHNCRKAAEAALTKMVRMLEASGFDPREIALSLADACDEHILRIARH